MIAINVSRATLARLAGAGLALVVLSGCDKLKEMMTKNADAGVDAAFVVDAAPVLAATPEDAGVDAAPPVVQVVEELPSFEGEEARANRDIGAGNYKEELDKLEKEADTAAKKK